MEKEIKRIENEIEKLKKEMDKLKKQRDVDEEEQRRKWRHIHPTRSEDLNPCWPLM